MTQAAMMKYGDHDQGMAEKKKTDGDSDLNMCEL